MSSRGLQDVFSVTVLRLQDVLEDEKLLRWRCVEDVLSLYIHIYNVIYHHIYNDIYNPSDNDIYIYIYIYVYIYIYIYICIYISNIQCIVCEVKLKIEKTLSL